MPNMKISDDNHVSFIYDLTKAPTPKDYHKATGLIHCVVKRHTTSGSYGLSSSEVHFAVQSSPEIEMTYLVAKKESTNGYAIVNNLDHIKIGALSRIQSSMSCITYALYNQEGLLIATILYDVPSIVAVLRDAPARRAQVALMPSQSLEVEMDPTWFEKACKNSIRKHGNLDALAEHAKLYESKVPYSKSGGRVGLNFQGRGRESSPKNMQICSGDKVVIQMAKWENDTYNIDFAAPFTFLHAFAFGLAQLDL